MSKTTPDAGRFIDRMKKRAEPPKKAKPKATRATRKANRST